MQRSKRHCKVETASGFGWKIRNTAQPAYWKLQWMQIQGSAGNGISQVLVRALGKSGKLETARSEVMSGKQIVEWKERRKPHTTYTIADECEPPVYRRQRASVRLFRQCDPSGEHRRLSKRHIERCGGGRPQRTERVKRPGW